MFSWLGTENLAIKTQQRDGNSSGKRRRDNSYSPWQVVGGVAVGAAALGLAGYFVRRAFSTTGSGPPPDQPSSSSGQAQCCCPCHSNGSIPPRIPVRPQQKRSQVPVPKSGASAAPELPGGPPALKKRTGDASHAKGEAQQGSVPDWLPQQWCDFIRDCLLTHYLGPNNASLRAEEMNALLLGNGFMGFHARLGHLSFAPNDAPSVTFIKFQDKTTTDVNFLVRLEWHTMPQTTATLDVVHNWLSMRQSTRVSQIEVKCEADVVAEITTTPGGAAEITLELLCEKVDLDFTTEPAMDDNIYTMLRENLLELLEGGVVSIACPLPP